MPTRIPVQVAEHQFPSLNKARIHYTGILHRNEVGGHLSESDQQEVMGLMASSHSPYPINDVSITVTRGFFSRPCFASIGPDKQPHYLSIIHSLKKCVEPGDKKATGLPQKIRLDGHPSLGANDSRMRGTDKLIVTPLQ